MTSERQAPSQRIRPDLLLGQWVQRKMTACRFAARLMKDKKIAVVEGGLDIERLNAALEELGQRGQTCMVFYPAVQREEHLVEVLHRLCRNKRWQGTLRTDLFDDRLAIRIDWLTAEGKWSNCLGMAPLLTMPAPRRAPYAALALWPGPSRSPAGDQAAQAAQKTRTALGITDIPTPYADRAQHEEMLAATEADVAQVFGGATKPWRKITFCLDARHQVAVEAALKGE